MVDLGGGPDGPIEHGFSNTVFIIPGLIIFGLSVMESLHYPRLEEIYTKSEYGNVRDLPTEKLLDILSGKELSYLDFRDVREVLLHRQQNGDPLLIKNSVTNSIPMQFFGLILLLLSIFAFFGWKLYQSLKDREKRREEKKKLKQKKKK